MKMHNEISGKEEPFSFLKKSYFKTWRYMFYDSLQIKYSQSNLKVSYSFDLFCLREFGNNIESDWDARLEREPQFKEFVLSFVSSFCESNIGETLESLENFVSYDLKSNNGSFFGMLFNMFTTTYKLNILAKLDIEKSVLSKELLSFFKNFFFDKIKGSILTERQKGNYFSLLEDSLEVDFKFIYVKPFSFLYGSNFFSFDSEYYKKLYNFYNEYVKPIEDSFFDKKSGYFKVEQRSKYDIYKKRSVSFLKNFLIVNQNDKDIGKNRMEYNYLLCYFKNTTRFKEALNFFKNIFYNYKLDLLYDHFFLGVSMLDLLRNFNFEMYLNIIEFKNLDEFYFTDFFVSKKFIENMKKMNVQNKIDNIHYQSDVL
jgi:hypothetical protein